MLEDNLTIEELAKKRLEDMGAGTLRRLLTSGRSAWTRGQVETIKTDKLLKPEIELVNGDQELIELLVQQEVIKARISLRFHQLLRQTRKVPFEMSSRGVRIQTDNYASELASKCEGVGWNFTPYYHEGIAYLDPISVGKTAEGSLNEIIPVLEKCYLWER